MLARIISMAATTLMLMFLSVTSTAAPSGVLKQKAQELLTEGNRLAGEGDFGAALLKFRTAYELYSSPKLLLNIEYSTYYYSLVDNLLPADFIHGLVKSLVFGLSIALTSCYFGIAVRGGAVGVGRAVNAAVVAAAVSIMVLDFFVTYLMG